MTTIFTALWNETTEHDVISIDIDTAIQLAKYKYYGAFTPAHVLLARNDVSATIKVGDDTCEIFECI